MSNPTEHTQTLAAFRENPTELLHQLKTTHHPITLTADPDGEPIAILQEPTEYYRLRDLAAQASAGEGIRQGLEELRAGTGRPATDFLNEMRAKYALPG
jgi:hypothetical protein